MAKVRFFKHNPEAKTPVYGSERASGMDVFAVEDAILPADGTVVAVDTGLTLVDLTLGYEIQVRSRSGNTLNKSFAVANAPGTVDSDFRGKIKVLLTSLNGKTKNISKGDKIAQFIVAPYIQTEIEEVIAPEVNTARGTGGFGSTGER